MSGGGSSKKKKASAPVEQTAYANAPTVTTLQPHLPGMQGLLAEQLARGFGGGGGAAPDFLAALGSMYQPMNLVHYNEPISVTKKNFDKKKNTPINTGVLSLDKLLMG